MHSSAQDFEKIVGSQPSSTQGERLRELTERASRLTMELEETLFWLDNGIEHRSRQFTDYKLSRSKWLRLDLSSLTAPLEVYSRALQRMQGVIFVAFLNVNSDADYTRVAELIPNLPSAMSIYVDNPNPQLLLAIRRDVPLFIHNHPHSTGFRPFLDGIQSQLSRTRGTHIFTYTAGRFHDIHPGSLLLKHDSKIAISFFGPSSGNLVLKLTHSSRDAPVTLVLKELHESHTIEPIEFLVPFESSFTEKTITLYSHLSGQQPEFWPNTRNNYIIQVSGQAGRSIYAIQDVRLQDEAANEYNGES
jgi:hypothetical protein